MPQYLFFVLTNVASKATCTHSPKSTHDCIKPCNIQSKTPNGRVTGLLQSTPTITPSPLFAGDSPYSTTIPNRSPQTPSTGLDPFRWTVSNLSFHPLILIQRIPQRSLPPQAAEV